MARKGIRQSEIERTLKALRLSGLSPKTVELRPDGTVQISTADVDQTREADLESELRAWERKHGQS